MMTRTELNILDDVTKGCQDMIYIFERHINNLPGPVDVAERWDKARAAVSTAKKVIEQFEIEKPVVKLGPGGSHVTEWPNL